MSASADLEKNLSRMESDVARAAERGADVVAFPEMAYFMGGARACLAVTARYEEIVERFSLLARSHGVELLPGSLREPTPGGPARYFNTALYFDRAGNIHARYRKVFLFRASLPDREYHEAELCDAGNEIVTARAAWGTLGLAICFDLRFPEMFRSLRGKGAELVFVPSAFTVPTGRLHWRPLVVARAIENQCFVVAPALTGRCGDGRETFGHSMIVSPWGEVLTEMGTEEGVTTCEIDLEEIAQYRKSLDAWGCRREDLFPSG